MIGIIIWMNEMNVRKCQNHLTSTILTAVKVLLQNINKIEIKIFEERC